MIPAMNLKTVRVPFDGKGREISYKLETIDLSMTPVEFINVYSVFVDDPDLKKVVGDHFTILHNQLQNPKPSFDVHSPGDIAEFNMKKAIAQQIMNESN